MHAVIRIISDITSGDPTKKAVRKETDYQIFESSLMTLLSASIFYWRSSGPNILIGIAVTLAVAILGYFACRYPKGRVVCIIIFGAWFIYVPFIFIGSKIWPEEVSISLQEMQGRHNFSQFSIDVADVRSIQGSRGGKGGYALHVFLKSKSKAVGIPVIWGQDKEAYKNALHKVCPDAALDW